MAAWILLLPAVGLSNVIAVVGTAVVPLGALFVGVRFLISLAPEGVQLVIATILRWFGRLPVNLKRVVVGNEVEGHLNRALKEFGPDGSNVAPHPAEVRWVNTDDLSSDSFFRDGRIIVKLDYSENPHRNVVVAAILYCKSGLLPDTRMYLWPQLSKAIDLTFIKSVMERGNMRHAFTHLVQEVLPVEWKKDPDVEKACDELQQLEDHGLFTTVYLPELRDYPSRVHQADTQTQHRQWITNFTEFLVEVVREHQPGEEFALDHIRKRIRVSLILVGKHTKLKTEGLRPYLKRIARCAERGAQTVFIVGAGKAVISQIANNTVDFRIANASAIYSYHEYFRRRLRTTYCARLEVNPATAAGAVDLLPAKHEWPEWESISAPVDSSSR